MIEHDRTCTWIKATAPHPMWPLLACHHLLQTVPPIAPRHALTFEVWLALLSHSRDWMTRHTLPAMAGT